MYHYSFGDIYRWAENRSYVGCGARVATVVGDGGLSEVCRLDCRGVVCAWYSCGSGIGVGVAQQLYRLMRWTGVHVMRFFFFSDMYEHANYMVR